MRQYARCHLHAGPRACHGGPGHIQIAHLHGSKHMNQILTKALPSITTMIRMDHTHVLSNFHKYRADLPSAKKRALVDLICTALEIHAQLEEEIFYPAMRAARAEDSVLDKSIPEHDEM